MLVRFLLRLATHAVSWPLGRLTMSLRALPPLRWISISFVSLDTTPTSPLQAKPSPAFSDSSSLLPSSALCSAGGRAVKAAAHKELFSAECQRTETLYSRYTRASSTHSRPFHWRNSCKFIQLCPFLLRVSHLAVQTISWMLFLRMTGRPHKY